MSVVKHHVAFISVQNVFDTSSLFPGDVNMFISCKRQDNIEEEKCCCWQMKLSLPLIQDSKESAEKVMSQKKIHKVLLIYQKLLQDENH